MKPIRYLSILSCLLFLSSTALADGHGSNGIYQANLLFKNLPFTKAQKNDVLVKVVRWREWLSFDVNDAVHISFDSIKVKPLGMQKGQIVAVPNHLQPKNGTPRAARGYGLEFRVDLDYLL